MVLAEELRQAVLQAALQGKLTEQLDTDSDVDEMLENILKEKKNLLNEKKAREEKEIPTVDEEEKSYDIPDNWRWERLGNIGIYKKGPFGSALTKSIFVPKGQNTVKVYEQKNAIQKDASLGEYYITKEYFESKMKGFIVEAGDIIVSCAGTIGETYIMPNDIEFGIINQALMRMNIVPSLNINYFLMYFDNILKSEARKGSKGSAIKNIPPFDVFKRMFIPLPPIEEQQRIVDKINEIMPKIDEYEKIEKELEAIKKEFPTNMKDALLQAAMQGKLTEQLESDSNVDELLVSIQKEKEELIAQKKIKKEKSLSDIEEEEIPFDIPENWRWVRLGNLGTLTRGSGIKRNEVTETGFPCVRYGELYTTYKTKFDVAVSHTSKKLFDKSQKVNRNDILMALTGENNFDIALALAYVGSETVAMGGDLTRWANHHMNPLYLVYAMNSSYAIHKKSEMAKGDIIVHISNDKLATILLPIPPIEEQNRIVERLDTLLPLCEDLKEE